MVVGIITRRPLTMHEKHYVQYSIGNSTTAWMHLELPLTCLCEKCPYSELFGLHFHAFGVYD